MPVSRRQYLGAHAAAAAVLPRLSGRASGDLIEQCRSQFAVRLRQGEELYHYFRLGLEILDRAAAALESGAEMPPFYAQTLREELEFLGRFYMEELDILERRRRAAPRAWLVTDHGLSPERENNLPLFQALLDRAAREKGGAVLIFPSGTFRFAPPPESTPAALHLRNLESVTLLGNGAARILVDGTHTPHSLLIEQCSDIQIRGIQFWMDPLPYTAGLVTAVAADSNEIEIEILAGHRRADEPVFLSSKLLRGKLHDPLTGLIDPSGGDPRVTRVHALGGNRFRLALAKSDLSSPPGLAGGFRTGRVFCLHARSDSGRGNGIEIRESRHVLFRDVAVHGASGHAVVIRDSAGVQFLDFRVEPAAGQFALNTADGFHIPGNRKGPYLERCLVERTNDDCVNFYSRAAAICAQPGPQTLLVHAAHGPRWQLGDALVLIDSNRGSVDGMHRVRSIRQRTWLGQSAVELEVEPPLALQIHTRESTGRGPVSAREYTPSGGADYQKAMSIAAPFEHLAANLQCKNDGFALRDCRMGNNRGSGFKCKASNGIVENWRLTNPSMGGGILFRIELDWREAFFPHQVLVRGCRLGGNRPVAGGGGLPGGKQLPASALPWLRGIELTDCWDEHGLKPLEWKLP